MRLVGIMLVSGLVMLARPSRADGGTVVVADCKTAFTSSAAAGYGIRVVAGGFTPGMQAYVHDLPSTNSKTRDAGFVGALNVKYGIKPANNTLEIVLVSDQAGATFRLEIKKVKTAGGEYAATLEKSMVGRTRLAVQDMVCTLPGAPHPACDESKRPIACPGGGGTSCVGGQWQCPPLPHR